MRSPAFHARIHPRQVGVVPVGPAAMPQGAGAQPTTSYSMYFTSGGGAMTFSAAPTATQFVIDTAAIVETPIFPSALPKTTIQASSASIALNSANATSTLTSSAAPSSTAASNITLPAIQIDPFQQVYNGMTLNALHAHPPWVIFGAIGGVALVVLLAAYCYICRWYYKRLPRTTARWDVDNKARENPIYGDRPNYTPNEEEKQVEDDRKDVPVGDSYFPQGETWRKFEGRTARHPESFIYTGDNDHPLSSPTTPPSTGVTPNSGTGLVRPRPRFATTHRGHVDSVFSTVSFPTTHRAESIRDSDFYPDGFEHDGEVWDLASPGFAAARPSLDSTANSASMARGSMSINRGSIFGEMSARARGSVVVFDSQPTFSPVRSSAPVLDEDPFAGPGEGNGGGTGTVYVYPVEKYAGKKSMDGGKKSMDGLHMRTRSRDIKLDTLVEDADEGRVTPIPRLLFIIWVVPLAPPKDDPYTLDQLKEFDGSDESKPLYLAIKGTVFDVSSKREMYGPGGSYALLAGKDASVALGKSSLKPEDAIPDWSTLEPSEKQTLDQWHGFFTKKYNVVGKVTDLPEAVRDAS